MTQDRETAYRDAFWLTQQTRAQVKAVREAEKPPGVAQDVWDAAQNATAEALAAGAIEAVRVLAGEVEE